MRFRKSRLSSQRMLAFAIREATDACSATVLRNKSARPSAAFVAVGPRATPMWRAGTARLLRALCCAALVAAASSGPLVYDSPVPAVVRVCVSVYVPFILERVSSARGARRCAGPRAAASWGVRESGRCSARGLGLGRQFNATLTPRARAELVRQTPADHLLPSELRRPKQHLGCVVSGHARLHGGCIAPTGAL